MSLEPLSMTNPHLTFEDAMSHATLKTPTSVGVVEMMDWEGLHSKLAARNEGSTQRQHLARLALEAARQAINELAALGHSFELKESAPPEVREFPKMLYHPTGGQREVGSEREQEAAMNDGWDVHPSLKESEY